MARRLPPPALALLAALALAATACDGDAGPAVATPAAPVRDLIAFVAEDTETGRFALYTVRPSGQELQLRATEEAPEVRFARWSPSGERIAYVAATGEGDSEGELRAYSFAQRQPSTIAEGVLTHDEAPGFSWSPEGDRLAYTDAASGGLRVYDFEAGTASEVGGASGEMAAWSPARDELVVVTRSGLELLDVAGGERRSLYQGPAADPAWSPDGERIAFSTGVPDGDAAEREVLVISRDGGDPVRLAPGFAPAWSPDGVRIAFSGPREGGPPADLDILIAAPDGDSDPEPLAPEPTITLDTQPVWSPDGARIAYVAGVDRRTALLCIAQLDPRAQDCLDLPANLRVVSIDWV